MLLLSYEGTPFHGWQVQSRQPTIEGALEQALLQVTHEPVKVYGAGRTDAGVHALNQTANFHSRMPFTEERWRTQGKVRELQRRQGAKKAILEISILDSQLIQHLITTIFFLFFV